jgi:hypothetical protein
MSPTQTSHHAAPGNPSLPGTAQWLYDEIMRNIEPDLITTRIIHLDEIYADETESEGKSRMQAYEKAFEIFDAAAMNFEKKFHAELGTFRKNAHKTAMEQERQEKAKNLKNLESTFDDA